MNNGKYGTKTEESDEQRERKEKPEWVVCLSFEVEERLNLESEWPPLLLLICFLRLAPCIKTISSGRRSGHES